MKILAKTFRFDKGVVYVIPLPNIEDYYGEDNSMDSFAKEAYNEACAYAREHPVVVPSENDKEKIWQILWEQRGNPKGSKSDWQPTDLTEYNTEGVRMEILKLCPCEQSRREGIPAMCFMCQGTKQIACLIEDDKQ